MHFLHKHVHPRLRAVIGITLFSLVTWALLTGIRAIDAHLAASLFGSTAGEGVQVDVVYAEDEQMCVHTAS